MHGTTFEHLSCLLTEGGERMAEVVPDLAGTVGIRGLNSGLVETRFPILQRERTGRNGHLEPCGWVLFCFVFLFLVLRDYKSVMPQERTRD